MFSRGQFYLKVLWQWRLWIFSALIVLFFVVVPIAISPTFQECIAQQPSNAASQTNNYSSSIFLVPTLLCVGEFVHVYAESIIALFTVILAASTIGLWWATWTSVRLTQKTFTDLERPYVYMMPRDNSFKGYFAGNDAGAIIGIVIKNIGRGPARIMKCHCDAGYFSPETKRGDYAQFRWEVGEFALGQGDSINHTFRVTPGFPLSPGTLENIQRNFRLIHINTWVEYLDAAGNRHVSSETWRYFLESDELSRVTIHGHT